jgi:branched-chain amino acid transport system ATP-binding protein
MGTDQVLLSVRNLGMRFGSLVALEALSFDVKRGEVFGIAGPNGAGKTTLFNVITGYYRGTGKILFDSREIQNLQPHQVCHRGIVRTFQIPKIFSSLTVYQNIKFGAHFGNRTSGGTEEDAVREILEFTELADKKDVVAKNVDLFTKKKIMLAAAIATKPKILLLDEPIGGLNPDEIDRFLGFLPEIREELGVTVMIIEHLMEYLVQLSDRMMILNFGKEICIGHPSEITADQKVIEVYLGED